MRRRCIRNIRNHLDADPKAKIVVVTHAPGIDFLLRDAKDKNGNPFDVAVQDAGCSAASSSASATYTLESRHIDPSRR